MFFNIMVDVAKFVFWLLVIETILQDFSGDSGEREEEEEWCDDTDILDRTFLKRNSDETKDDPHHDNCGYPAVPLGLGAPDREPWIINIDIHRHIKPKPMTRSGLECALDASACQSEDCGPG